VQSVRGFLSGNGDDARTLVVVFLRGGADGLTLVPPLADDDYHRARPRLGVSPRDAARLDELFGLHPRLRPLHTLYDAGEMCVVHAVGSEDTSRSHFEAQDLMEHGGVAAGGWLGRFLRAQTGAGEGAVGALPAVAIGSEIPASLRGAPSAAAVRTLDEFSLGTGAARLVRALEGLYALEGGSLGSAARDTLAALRRIEALRAAPYAPAGGADYPSGELGSGLLQIARLIKARVGLQAASVDLGGWDSHFTQGTLIDPLMEELARALLAFHRDLGPLLETTTIVVMTEFGRRLRENASFGTDHGRGSVMLVLGGGVHGGRVVSRWPRLAADALDGPGDLAVTTNYRDVLAAVLRRHGASEQALGRVFPGFAVDPVALYG
jgi:uncharacterized protein (DUF1501 family)